MSDGDFSAILGRAGLDSDALPWREIVARFARPGRDRPAFLHGLAGEVSNPDHATALIRALAAEPDADSRRLALELAALTPTLDRLLIPWLRPLLRDRRTPRRVLLEAAKALVAASGPRGGTTVRVLRDFAAGFGRLRVLHFRASLQKHFAGVAAFDRLCERLIVVMPLRCPRCGVRRDPRSMARHLWHRHRRLLSDRRVRSPMAWMDDWSSNGPADRDPLDGLAELSQLLLRRELDDGHAEADLHFVADRKNCIVCPHCRALVPRPPDRDFGEPLEPLELSDHRLSGEDIVLARAASGFRATIVVTDECNERTTLPDPRGSWRTAPAARRFVLPWISLALVLAATLPARWAVLGVGLALAAACAIRILVRVRSAPESSGSLIDAAWQYCKRGAPADRFVARLALTSRGRGRPDIRMRILETATEKAASGPISEWAPLAALRVRDADAVDDDPVRLTASYVGDALRDDRFAVRVERLLALLTWQEWPVGQRRRLRAAVAEQCFSFGLGIRDLTELGRALPQFRQVLETRDIANLALLRHIWNLRAEPPWPNSNPVSTIFELSRYPAAGDEVLDRYPDALFSIPLPGWGPRGRVTPLVVSACGLHFRGALVPAPATVEVHLRRYGRGYVLHFGTHRFQYQRDPSPLATTVWAWSEFASKSLTADAMTVADQLDGLRLERLLKSVTYACPSCGRLLREQP